MKVTGAIAVTAVAICASLVTQNGAFSQTTTAQEQPFPKEVCSDLVEFLRRNPGIDTSKPRVTLTEVERYAREDNRYACRAAAQGLLAENITLPRRLLDNIGVKP
jgi:hypothetical protein